MVHFSLSGGVPAVLSGAMISMGRRWRSQVPRSIHPSAWKVGLSCIFEGMIAAHFHKLVVVVEVAGERQVLFS
jgi:hypothetical protein